MYHALYRKYRPVDFDSVVGQDVIVKTLKNSIISNSVSHAYIFFGSRGTGKTTLSKIFARNVNCLSPKEGNACGKCSNCLVSFSKECVDIIEIDAASNNGVDEIRDLRSKISLVPSQLKYKVYIIDEVHMLSTGAFNALLKTLEEPPEHVIFILATTDLQKVPETIVSRCQCFSFQRISESSIVERLKYVCGKENIEIEDKVLKAIASSSKGGLRDALGSLDQISSFSSNKITYQDYLLLSGSISDNDISDFLKFLFQGDVENTLSCINHFYDSGKNFIQIIFQLIDYLRGIIISYYEDSNTLDFSFDYYYNLLNMLINKLSDFKKSTNVRLLFEVNILKFLHDNIMKSSNNVSYDIKSSLSFNSSNENKDKPSVSSLISEPIETEKSSIIDNPVDMSYPSNIINIDEIMKVRINNTFAGANKELLKTEIQNFELLKDYTFDQEIGYIVCSLLDSTVRVVSKDNILISFPYDSNVKQNINILDKISEVYYKITKSNKNFAIVTDSNWEKLKSEYVYNLKNHIAYQILEEPKVIFEENENNDIINNGAIELFGDIVEIE